MAAILPPSVGTLNVSADLVWVDQYCGTNFTLGEAVVAAADAAAGQQAPPAEGDSGGELGGAVAALPRHQELVPRWMCWHLLSAQLWVVKGCC